MKMGTKSILYGAHCFFIHPWVVAYAWWKLYGFPWDPRLWIAFYVHDLGYWGKPNMDGPEGEDHVWFGAHVMGWLFDQLCGTQPFRQKTWFQFCFYHSRYMCKRYGAQPSKLCFADKAAFLFTPAWLYKLQVRLTGEWREYAQAHHHEVGAGTKGLDEWYTATYNYMTSWINLHINGEEDTWTKAKNNT